MISSAIAFSRMDSSAAATVRSAASVVKSFRAKAITGCSRCSGRCMPEHYASQHEAGNPRLPAAQNCFQRGAGLERAHEREVESLGSEDVARDVAQVARRDLTQPPPDFGWPDDSSVAQPLFSDP